jgi:hypothetical protein
MLLLPFWERLSPLSLTIMYMKGPKGGSHATAIPPPLYVPPPHSLSSRAQGP